MNNLSAWLAPLLEALIQISPHLFQRKTLQALLTTRDELVKGQDFCQFIIRKSGGYVIVPNSVLRALLQSPLKPQTIPFILKKAHKAAEEKYAAFSQMPGAAAAMDKVVEICFLTFYHGLLTEVEDQFAARWWVNGSIRKVIRARERYDQLEHLLRNNLRAQIQRARTHPDEPLTLPPVPLALKSTHRGDEALERALLASHEQTAALIKQLVRKEKNHLLPEAIFVELMICKRRDLFLSQVEDLLLAESQ